MHKRSKDPIISRRDNDRIDNGDKFSNQGDNFSRNNKEKNNENNKEKTTT